MSLVKKLRSLIVTDPDVGRKVRVIGLKDEVEEVSKVLQSVALFEVSPPREAGAGVLREVEELAGLVERASRLIAEFMRRLGRQRVVKLEYLPPFEELRKTVRSYVEDLERDLEEILGLEAKIVSLEDKARDLALVRRYLEHLVSQRIGLSLRDLLFEGDEVTTLTIAGAPRGWRTFIDECGKVVHIVSLLEEENVVVATILFMSRDRDYVLRSLRSHGLRTLDVLRELGDVGIEECISAVSREVEKIEEEMRMARARISTIIERDVERLALLKLFVDNEGERLKLLSLAVASRYAFFVEGWVPASQLQRFVEEVYSRSRSCIVEIVETNEEPPVVMRNPKPLKPFEMIPTFYGYPSPGEWDPTPVMAYFFVFFFAFILGDAGYAIGIALATRYLLPKLVDNPESEGFKSFQKILYVCAFAAAVFGVLMGGCFFGPHWWVPSITPHSPVKCMPILITLSMWVGYVHMIMAHALAAAKNRRARDLWGFVNELCIVGIMIFGGMYIASWLRILPIPYAFAKSVLLPVALACLAGIVISRIKSMGGLGAMLWIFDLTGPLSDVISYVRLAALDMATMLMAYVFNNAAMGILASMNHALGPVIGVAVGILVGGIIAVFGHIFNIALGALGAFVHSLRLCILEFGTKFYEGMGRPLSPVAVRVSRYVTLAP